MRICQACGFDRCNDLTTHCPQCGARLPDPRAEEEVAKSLAPAWFHYLEIPQVGTVELTPGQAFSIGKGARCDLRLTQVRSERLASIFWTEDFDEATIERHPTSDASERVEVNDLRLSGTRILKGTEELTIGPVRLTYLKRARKILSAVQRKRGRIGRDPSRAVAREESDGMLLEPRSRRFNAPPPKTGAPRQAPPAAGKKPGPTPLEIALSLEQGQLTGLLRVDSPRGSGWVSLRSGAPNRALFNELRGEPAVAAILQQARAKCAFTPGGEEPSGGEPVKVSFSTVKNRIERHRAATQVLRRQQPPTQKIKKPPEPPPPRAWGDGAR